ncbi:MAG TPA: septum site-determining protein MinC [Aggregatilineales bacterium]|jgi:septum site-determining protein MinC|nr:septum site-determining protein MinC [Aggregatilineales bacterium]
MSTVSIKGIRNGLLVALDEEAAWPEVEEALLDIIRERSSFFQGAHLALQLGGRTLNRDDIRKLRDRLAEHDVQLAAILGKSAETIRSARRLDIDTDLDESVTYEELDDGELPPIDTNEHGSPGVLVKTTLRSGRVVKHAGHVVVIGDVNPGAQVIAGGDVLVWGRLRGTVHAGANGDTEALVCALDMRPMQLRIANYVAIASDNGEPRPRPEIASVRDGQIVSEEWGV